MLLVECNDVKKFFGDRLILDIKNFKINENEKIGIVGANGSGKTTLLNLLTRVEEAEEGSISLNADYFYVGQLNNSHGKYINSEMASRFL